MPDEVCEHCLIGIRLYSFYGRFRVYECELGLHHKDYLAGFVEPCNGYPGCVDEHAEIHTFRPLDSREAPYKDWVYTYTFHYKRIPRDKMRKSKACIEQEKEEAEEKKEEAERLRKDAMELMRKADEVEK